MTIAAVHQVVLSASGVHVLVATLIPIAVGLVTKLSAAPKIKVPVTLLLTGLATWVTKSVVDDGTAVLSVQSLVTFVELYLMQLAAFLGLVKPLGVREKVLAPQAGLG